MALGVSWMAFVDENHVESYLCIRWHMLDHTISPRSPSSSCCRSWALGLPSLARSLSLAHFHNPRPVSRTPWPAWMPGRTVVSVFIRAHRPKGAALSALIPSTQTIGPLLLLICLAPALFLAGNISLVGRSRYGIGCGESTLALFDFLAQLGIRRLSLGGRHFGAWGEIEGPSLFGALWWWSIQSQRTTEHVTRGIGWSCDSENSSCATGPFYGRLGV